MFEIFSRLFASLKSNVRDGARSSKGTLQSIGQLLVAILLFPIRVVFYPFELIIRVLRRSGTSDDPYQIQGTAPKGLLPATGFWLKRILLGIFILPLKAVDDFVQRLASGNRRDLLYILPAMLMLGFFGFVFFQVFARGGQIDARYRKGAYDAIENQDFPLARTYFERLVSQSELNANDQFEWARVLNNTGEPERALMLINRLGPDDRPGFAPAHRVQALNLAAKLGSSKDPLQLRKLRSHLENCRDDSPEISRAWAAYHLAVGQADEALKYLGDAAETNPELLMLIANIHQQNGRVYQMEQAMEEAETAFGQRVAKDPLDVVSRVALANILARQSKFDEAETTLLTGLKLQPEARIRRETAAFYLMRHDLASKQDKDFNEIFSHLQNALTLDPTSQAICERFLGLYENKSNAEESEKIKNALMESVTGDNPSAMSHFALSNLFWLEGQLEEAEWHLEQAYKLDQKLVIVINNLAWMLANKDEPDLARALELSSSAIQQAPQDSRFQETYATILMKQKKFEEAIFHFQKALPGSQIGPTIHEKLATCYRELGKPELAELHQKRAAGSQDGTKTP